MARHSQNGFFSKPFVFLTIGFCVLLLLLLAIVGFGHADNNTDSFSEITISLPHGWIMTDSVGNSSVTELPKDIDFGQDGRFSLSCTLPDVQGVMSVPALRFYSNYVDVDILLDNELLYSYPVAEAAFSGATGNTYHFVRLPLDYAGKTLTIVIRCQLGDDITYLLKPPTIGSKATMLRLDIMESLPAIVLAGCMIVLSLGLAILYLAFRQRLGLNNATIYTSMFALLFAAYIYCETSFAQVITPNGYLLCFCTLMLLCIMPIPLTGLFSEEVSFKFKPVITCVMVLCSVNCIVQSLFNFAGILSFRVMLPATHFVIVTSITAMAVCLMLSDKNEKAAARRKLASALPMIIGGITDITLIWLKHPSFNNSLWFVIGVSIFIVIQFCDYLKSIFAMYRRSLESELLHDMAYKDLLTGIGNRNAYESKLRELSENTPSSDISCIVLDINDLKHINDTLGHHAGDTAIIETGGTLSDIVPDCGTCFRIGGDEFIVLLNGLDEDSTEALAKLLCASAHLRGKQHSIPISLAIGYGNYKPSDGNINDFIRRVDTLMYEYKRNLKKNPNYSYGADI